MPTLLAADIGGTKVLLQISKADGEVIIKQRFDSHSFASFEQMLTVFLQQAGDISIDIACFAIAAPVFARRVKVTNLPWVIDADFIARQFKITNVLLCNDFEAVGYGIAGLNSSQLHTLQKGTPQMNSPKAVIGGGTGLGQALLIEHNHGWQVYPTEGGHVDFSPTESLQIHLLEHLLKQRPRVTAEQVLSGKGLEMMYCFLRDFLQIEESYELCESMVNGDAAAAISDFADIDPLAEKAMTMFFSIYGAQAGNFALSTLPKQGLYIAGGIAAKNLGWFERDNFMRAFLDKSPMTEVMTSIPVHVITDPEIGLTGARLLAEKAMYN